MHLKKATAAVEFKSYSEIKDIKTIKGWVCDLGKGEGGYGTKLGIFLCINYQLDALIIIYS